MSPERNPFLKPPSKPTNKDTAGFIESVLGKQEGDAARKVIGKHQQETKPALEFTALQLTSEEKAKAEEYEKNRPWTRDQVVEWAGKLGKREEWVDKTFTFHEDGFITVDGSFHFGEQNITEIPRGIKSMRGTIDLFYTAITSLKGFPTTIEGSLYIQSTGITSLEGIPTNIRANLDISVNSITSLKGLESVSIGGSLSLNNIDATDMPPGVHIGGAIIIDRNQKQLIASLKKNGYAAKLVDKNQEEIL